MNKPILAAAVAAALVLPVAQADTILYGSARVSIDYNDYAQQDSRNWDIVNDDSRLGVQGMEDLGGGLSAVYQYEFGVDMTEGGNWNSNRPKFVGLKGGFGTLTLGTQDTPYYHVVEVVDIFNSSATLDGASWLGGSFDGFNYGDVRVGGEPGRALVRMDNSVYYSTPNFNGFSGEAMLVMNRDASFGHSDGIDQWNIAAKYSNGPFFAGASYVALDGKKRVPISEAITVDLDLDQWNIGLGYAADAFSVGFIYEKGNLNQFGLLNNATLTVDDVSYKFSGEDATNWYLAGEYRFGRNTLRASYGQLDTKLNVPTVDNKIDNYLAGYQYDLSKRTRLWVEYVGRSADKLVYGDRNVVSIGTRHDF